jgi:hypothetical protein
MRFNIDEDFEKIERSLKKIENLKRTARDYSNDSVLKSSKTFLPLISKRKVTSKVRFNI